jgi:hypothetical protein
LIYSWNPSPFRDFTISTLLSAGIATTILGIVGKRWLSAAEARHARELEKLKAKYLTQLEGYKNELERSKQLLQAEIDKTFLVTKVHFEAEFQALKDVFALLAEIRLHLPNLRPRTRIAPSDETRQARTRELDKAALALQELYNKLAAVSENTSPFYPPEINAQISACEQVIRIELAEIALTQPQEAFTFAWFNRGEAHLKEFMESYARASALIRERIAKMAIVRNT